MILESSDWHCGPEGLSEEAREFIRKGKALGATLVGNGDLFDLLPVGFDVFVNSAAIREFKEEIGDYPFYYIAGNHDPYKWVKKLFLDSPEVIVSRHLELHEIHLRHGHEWSFDWWLLRHFAPQIVTFMVDVFPKQWYWLCRRVGWLPGQIKKDVDQGRRERTDYNTAVGKVWDAALKHAQKHKQIVIIGHTHCSGRMLGAIGNIVTTVFADGGDLKDMTCIMIEDGDVRLLYLQDIPD